MTLQEIKSLIDKDIVAAFEELDKWDWKDDAGIYEDFRKDYIDPPEGMSRTEFRDRLKIFVASQYRQPKPLPVKPNPLFRPFIFILLTVLITLLGFTTWDHFAAPNEEDLAFQKAKDARTLPALEDFLDKFPSGRHAKEAKQEKGILQDSIKTWLEVAEQELKMGQEQNALGTLAKIKKVDPPNEEANKHLDDLIFDAKLMMKFEPGLAFKKIARIYQFYPNYEKSKTAYDTIKTKWNEKRSLQE